MTPQSSQGKVEWMQKNPYTNKDLGLKEVWQAGSASRDDEVKRLREALEAVASFGKEHPFVGLTDSKGYGADLREVVKTALMEGAE